MSSNDRKGAKPKMKLKPIAIFTMITILSMIMACEPQVIDLNDDEMPPILRDTEWVKARYTTEYGDLCLREDYREFQYTESKFISRTVYDFENEDYTDATVTKTYKATFNLDVFPKRMKAVLEGITMNGQDVTGMEEVEFGADTREFEDEGFSLYYVFNADYTDDELDTLILASNEELYPDYIAVNQQCYTKIYDDTQTLVPDDFAATWKIATFRDRIKDTVLDEPFMEYKQRSFTGTQDGDYMYVKSTYHFSTLPKETYLFTYEMTIEVDIFGVTSVQAELISVSKNGVDVTGDDGNIFGTEELPLPDAGFNLSFILSHEEDAIRYTDLEGETPPVTFDGTVYTLSDSL
jgi:hypothetical protein